VLACAARVFSLRGYEGTSVRDLAEALGLSKGSLYYYARTKQDLLYRILDSVHGENEQILAKVRAIPGLEPLDRIALYVRRQVAFNLANPERISVYYAELYRLEGERLATMLARRRMHDDFVADQIRAAQAAGLVDPAVDPRLASNLVFNTVGRDFHWYRADDAAGIDEVAELCARFAVGGLVSRARDAPS
jgi:AcrR family transcriptional regulator